MLVKWAGHPANNPFWIAWARSLYFLGFVNIQILSLSLLLSVPQTWSFLHRIPFGHVNYQFLNPWPTLSLLRPMWVNGSVSLFGLEKLANAHFLSGSRVAIGQLKSICFVDRQPWLPVPAQHSLATGPRQSVWRCSWSIKWEQLCQLCSMMVEIHENV